MVNDKDLMKFKRGDLVYHKLNPKIKGIIVDSYTTFSLTKFRFYPVFHYVVKVDFKDEKKIKEFNFYEDEIRLIK